MLFPLGSLVATSGVINWTKESEENNTFVANSIARHITGDWGELCDEDKELNNEAVKEGNRILSAYSHNNEKIWVITESDRSSTTVLFPSEY